MSNASDEVVPIPMRADKYVNGLPRHKSARDSGGDLKPPPLWSARESKQFPEAVGGQYPKGFLDFLSRVLGVARPLILHLCSGSLKPGEGLRVDLRREAAPDVIADARTLPFEAGVFDAVAIDPPYSLEYAKALYGIDYPRPSHLLAEAARVVKSGAPVSMLHFLVPASPPELIFSTVCGVTTGVGYRIRALTVWRKRDADLFE